MLFFAVTQTVPMQAFGQFIGFGISVEFFNVITLETVAKYTNPSLEESVSTFMDEMEMPFAIVIPVSRATFREILRQNPADGVVIVPNTLPSPSLN